MLTKRYESDSSANKEASENTSRNQSSERKHENKKPPNRLIFSNDFEFSDLHNIPPKGSTVNKLSLIFPDENTFYTKLHPFSIEIGQRIKETQYLQEDLHCLHVKFGNIEAKGISTNIRKVTETKKRQG